MIMTPETILSAILLAVPPLILLFLAGYVMREAWKLRKYDIHEKPGPNISDIIARNKRRLDELRLDMYRQQWGHDRIRRLSRTYLRKKQPTLTKRIRY